jgi:hypothetical protein
MPKDIKLIASESEETSEFNFEDFRIKKVLC